MLDLVIKNGYVVNANGTQKVDVAVKDGRIVALGDAEVFGESAETLDAKGMYVFPGLIDSHVHIHNTVGEFHSLDNYYDATIAAAYGGTTSFIDFTFPEGAETPIQALERKLEETKGKSVLDFSFHPCLTNANRENYDDIRQLLKGGLPSTKMFTVYRDTLMLEKSGVYKVMKMIAEEGGLAMVHAETPELIERNIADFVAGGKTTPKYHALSRPPISEIEAMYGVLAMAKDTGAAVLFAHMTSGLQAGELLREAKAKYPIFSEVCPHYLTLNSEVYMGENGQNYICSPPIRSQEEQDGLWSLIQEGLVDVINSDHTDYSSAQKDKYKDFFPKAPNGLPTLETRGVIFYSEGVAKGRISVNKFVEMTSTKTAKLMGMFPKKGIIQAGSDADLVVFDPHAKYTMAAKSMHMKTDYSPYEGLEVIGKAVHTIVRGHFIIKDGVFTGTNFRGEFLKRTSPIFK